MSLASDNWAGASKEIVEAVSTAMLAQAAPAYGGDAWTKRAENAISAFFGCDCAVFFLTSGTAANALSIAHLTPPWGTVYAHEMAHVFTSECGAPEFYSQAKLAGVSGHSGKMTLDSLSEQLKKARLGDAHSTQPATLSITNLNECGTFYRAGELAALCELAKAHQLAVHLDGARFANALVASNASPAELSWKAGVDVMSLGATKNGAMAAEAVIFFDPARAKDFLFRRMRGGHLLSKMRFVAAQFEAWLHNDHWRTLATNANAMATRLADGLKREGFKLAWPAEGNEVFPLFPKSLAEALRAQGFVFHSWPGERFLPPGVVMAEDEEISRLICSFKTTAGEIDQFLAALRAAK